MFAASGFTLHLRITAKERMPEGFYVPYIGSCLSSSLSGTSSHYQEKAGEETVIHCKQTNKQTKNKSAIKPCQAES